MNCKDVSERAVEFLDDALAPTASAGIRSHLQTCAACASMIEDIRAQAQWLKALPAAEAPAGAWSRLKGSIESPAPKRPWRRWAALAAAAAALVAIGAALFYRPGPAKYFDVVLRERTEALSQDETAEIEGELGSMTGAGLAPGGGR